MMKIDNNTAKDDNIVNILNEDNYYDNNNSGLAITMVVITVVGDPLVATVA